MPSGCLGQVGPRREGSPNLSDQSLRYIDLLCTSTGVIKEAQFPGSENEGEVTPEQLHWV